MGTIPLFQVYGLYDPYTGELRYIGETTMSLRRRQRAHVDGVRYQSPRDYNYQRRGWIKQLLSAGAEPEIRLIESVKSAEEMHQCERKWIAYYTAAGAPLLNANTMGGKGVTPGSPGAIAIGDKTAKTYLGFIDPDGNPVTITNMKRYCEAHGLTRKSMMDVYNGCKLSHKGYRHTSTIGRPPKNIHCYRGFIRPDGTREPPVWGVATFCATYGLHKSRVWDLIQGKCLSYRGWRWELPDDRSMG